MKRVLITICLLLAAGALFWRFPLFHVVAVGQGQASAPTTASAAELARSFWSERLEPSFPQAADVVTVLAALRDAPEQARREYGRSAGLGRATLLYVRGSGTIVDIDERGIGIATDPESEEPDVHLQIGLVSGNTVRDATGLLNASDHSNSQLFNSISTELNRMVETDVISRLKKSAKVGQRVQFVGCARVVNLPADISPLMIIPVDARIHAENL